MSSGLAARRGDDLSESHRRPYGRTARWPNDHALRPIFGVKVPSEPSQPVANCAVTKFCAVPILDDWGKDRSAEPLNGGFFIYIVDTPLKGQRKKLKTFVVVILQ